MTGDSEAPLEVIELEPAASARAPRDRHAAATGVRRRRVPIILAIVVVVGLGASVIAARGPHHDRAGGTTSTTNPRDATINLRGGGQIFPVRVGARVLTGGPFGLRLVDTDTGHVEAPTVAGLPGGAVTIVAHSGPTVAVQVAEQMYWFSMSVFVAHRVDADTAFAAVEPDHLWLASPQYATEVPGDTDRLPRNRVTTAALAIGATRDGLVEILQTGEGARLQATSGAETSHPFLPADATIIGVHPDRVAWVAGGCGVLRCPVHVTEVATGKTSSWLQLPGHPSPLSLAGSTALFAPDGGRVAVIVPDNNITNATTLVVADLRDRTTTVVNTTGYVAPPARPGSGDGAGETIDWTRDGAYLVLAPALGTGAGRLSAVDPANARVLSSRVSLDIGSTAAATGTSSLGALDLPRRAPGPIPTGPTPGLVRPGLDLVGGDARQVDVLDLGTDQVQTLQVGAVQPNPSGPFSLARVSTGWLVARNGLVSLMRTGAPPGAASELVDAGTQVLSSRDGRIAWIGRGNAGEPWTVDTYDPATGALGHPIAAGVVVGAVDAGLVTTALTTSGVTTQLQIIDAAGRVHAGPIIDSDEISVLAAAGTHVVYADARGLYALDLTSGQSHLLSEGYSNRAALSPDGTVAAWVAPPLNAGHVLARRLDSDTLPVPLGTSADRLLVADDGTVLFTNGLAVSVGRAGTPGAQRVYGLAPDPSSELALG